MMKTLIKLEEFGMFIASAYGLYLIDIGISKWWYLLIFFAPDLGIAGYLAGNKTGAVIYNIFHHKLVACTIAVFGYFTQNHFLLFTGMLLFSHSSFDRMLGYGLKYYQGFKFTHLGTLKSNGTTHKAKT